MFGSDFRERVAGECVCGEWDEVGVLKGKEEEEIVWAASEHKQL